MTFGFEIVNIFAVFGTTFLMMAVKVLWYTKPVFGSWVPEKNLTEERDSRAYVQVALATLSSFVALFIVSYASALTPVLSLQDGQVALGLFVFAAALRAHYALLEKQTLRHLIADFLYLAVFIIGGAFIFAHWPS